MFLCVCVQELQCSFSDISSEDPRSVLEKLLLSDQAERFRKAQAFIRAQGLSSGAVAELVSSAIVQVLLATGQEPPPGEDGRRRLQRGVCNGKPPNICVCVCPSEGRGSLVQLIKLCDDPTLVGLKLLEQLSSVSLRDMSCSMSTHRRHTAARKTLSSECVSVCVCSCGAADCRTPLLQSYL